MELKDGNNVSREWTPRGSGAGPQPHSVHQTNRPLIQQVFEFVRAAGSSSRAQVARALDVSPASITTASTELISLGLLQEVAAERATDGDTGRGRPPVALGVRSKAHHVAGIKVSDNNCTAVILDFAGEQVAGHVLPIPSEVMSVEELLEVILGALEAVLKKAGFQRSAISAVGLGIPGFVNHLDGHVHWSPIMHGKNIDLAQLATRHLGVDCVIDNDANLVTLAELWFGAGRQIPNFAVVTIEHGLGMGVVIDHSVYRGAKGVGLELGHSKVQLDGALCRCGQRGCLEAYVADYALVREARTALQWLGDRHTSVKDLLEVLFEEAKGGNAAAQSIFRRAGRYLAVGLANVINIFDPALIVLSGERMKYDYLYASDTLAELDDLVIRTGRDMPTIEVNAWGDLVWAKGAAALAMGALTDRILGTSRDLAAE